MKKSTIVLFFTLLTSIIFADTIVFKDGNTVTGEVLKTLDTEIIVNTPLGVITIEKDKIDKVVSEIKDEPVTKIEIITRDVFKYDPDYRTSRRLQGIAMTFFIAGNIITFGTLAIGTPFVYQYYSTPVYRNDYVELYDKETQSIYYDRRKVELPHNYIGALTYGYFIFTGLTLSAISIPFFISSSKYLNKFKDRYYMGLSTGFDGDKFSFAFNLSL